MEASWGVLEASWVSLGESGQSWEGLGDVLEASGVVFGGLGGVLRDALVFTGFLHVFLRNFNVFSGGGSLKNLEKPEENLGFFDVLKDWQFLRNP